MMTTPASSYHHKNISESYRPQTSFLSSLKRPNKKIATPFQRMTNNQIEKIKSILDTQQPYKKCYIPELKYSNECFSCFYKFSMQLVENLNSYFGEELQNELIRIHDYSFFIIKKRIDINIKINESLKGLIFNLFQDITINKYNIEILVEKTKNKHVASLINSKEVDYCNKLLQIRDVVLNFSKKINKYISNIEKESNTKIFIKDLSSQEYFFSKEKNILDKTKEDRFSSLINCLCYSNIIFPNQETYMESFKANLAVSIEKNDDCWLLERSDLVDKRSIYNSFLSFVHSSEIIISYIKMNEKKSLELERKEPLLTLLNVLIELEENLNFIFTYIETNKTQNKMLSCLKSYNECTKSNLENKNNLFSIKNRHGFLLSYKENVGFFLDNSVNPENQWGINNSLTKEEVYLNQENFSQKFLFYCLDKDEDLLYKSMLVRTNDSFFKNFYGFVLKQKSRFLKNKNEKQGNKIIDILDILSDKNVYPRFSDTVNENVLSVLNCFTKDIIPFLKKCFIEKQNNYNIKEYIEIYAFLFKINARKLFFETKFLSDTDQSFKSFDLFLTHTKIKNKEEKIMSEIQNQKFYIGHLEHSKQRDQKKYSNFLDKINFDVEIDSKGLEEGIEQISKEVTESSLSFNEIYSIQPFFSQECFNKRKEDYQKIFNENLTYLSSVKLNNKLTLSIVCASKKLVEKRMFASFINNFNRVERFVDENAVLVNSFLKKTSCFSDSNTDLKNKIVEVKSVQEDSILELFDKFDKTSFSIHKYQISVLNQRELIYAASGDFESLKIFNEGLKNVIKQDDFISFSDMELFTDLFSKFHQTLKKVDILFSKLENEFILRRKEFF